MCERRVARSLGEKVDAENNDDGICGAAHALKDAAKGPRDLAHGHDPACVRCVGLHSRSTDGKRWMRRQTESAEPRDHLLGRRDVPRDVSFLSAQDRQERFLNAVLTHVNADTRAGIDTCLSPTFTPSPARTRGTSMSFDPNGNYRILYVDHSGQETSIQVSARNDSDACAFAVKRQHGLAISIWGKCQIDKNTSRATLDVWDSRASCVAPSGPNTLGTPFARHVYGLNDLFLMFRRSRSSP